MSAKGSDSNGIQDQNEPLNANEDKSKIEVENSNSDAETIITSEKSKISPETSNNTISLDIANNLDSKKKQQGQITVGNFFSLYLFGSLECGYFNNINDVYVKYSVLAGPDWLVLAGTELGITQIARYRIDGKNEREFVWNQPITVSYRSYNFFGYPQLIVSVYNFDLLGNDQLVGYGFIHLPMSNHPAQKKQIVQIYSPQSSSYTRQFLSWITGRKPELVDFNLIARGDCRSVLRMVNVGKLVFSFNLTTKDVANNGYKVG